ncbi:MAG: bile acid:sodium symporter [Pirellulaceae bacterium]|nr:bile acid:sodium symporter [Pirellulaceae bacterium]
MLHLLRRYWFLVALAAAVLIGLLGHEWLLPVAKLSWLTTGIVMVVMAMMTAPVPMELVRQTLARPWPAVLASLINLGILPILGWCAAWWLPSDLAGGLIVAACVPSTLSSAAVMTRQAGGDDTVCIFVTLLTNVCCVVVTPLWLVGLLGVNVQLNLADMVQNLCLVVLLPIAVVQITRWQSAAFSDWASRSAMRLSFACQIGILSMVLLGSVQMGSRWQDQAQQLGGDLSSVANVWTIAAVVLLGLLIHLTALVVGWYTSRLTGIDDPQCKAVSFSGSQKTLMVGLNLAIQCGVNILPMITYHVFQLLFDAVIAQRWGRRDQHKNSALSKVH